MISEPQISIIIPTYNYANYIGEALNSVAAQSYTEWECIVVDDGSTDHTAEVVAAFVAAHPAQEFRYVFVENSGTSAAKNTGIDLARGKYIQFLDADDLLSVDKLSIQVRIMYEQDCALVYSESRFFTDSNSKAEVPSKYPPGFLASRSLTGFELLSALLHHNLVTIGSPLVHKALVLAAGNFERSIRNNEDWLLWFRIALINPIFVFDGDSRSFCRIRIHPSSAMNDLSKMFSGEVTVRELMALDLKAKTFGRERELLMKKNLDQLALHRIRSLDWYKGWRHVLASFVEKPAENLSLVKKSCYQTMVRMYRIIVPIHGA
jgi:glycosyltransferase involved in cell wall biosynthesis